MKVLLIIGNLPKTSPYISYYINVFKEHGIDYDIVAWNREGEDYVAESNCYVYDKKSSQLLPSYKKIIDMIRYSGYIKSIIKKNNYDAYVVYTVAISVFLYGFLKRHKKKYIIDVRDYSPLLRKKFFNKRFTFLCKNSLLNCISSLGFRKWLPEDCDYVLCHNVNKQLLTEAVVFTSFKHHSPIRVLTIGQIRDSLTNADILKALSNLKDIEVYFSGRGGAIPYLKNVASDEKIENVHFTGSYDKSEELNIVSDSDIVNCILPNNILSNYLMSNRLYTSVLSRRPIVVRCKTTQAYYVQKYKLGFVVDNIQNLHKDIVDYLTSFNYDEYDKGCRSFLLDVKDDVLNFERTLYSNLSNI